MEGLSRLETAISLTLTLSPRRGESKGRWMVAGGIRFQYLRLYERPSPKGEGWGEGKVGVAKSIGSILVIFIVAEFVRSSSRRIERYP